MIRRAVAALACSLAIVAASGAVVLAPAAAQAQTPTFVLAGQSGWVKPGEGFLLRLSATNVPPGAQVAVTVHDALQSRTAFDESVNGGRLPPSRELTKVPFDKRGRPRPAAQRFEADDTGAGKDIVEGPVRHGIAKDAEEGFAYPIRRGTETGVDGASQLASP